MHVPAVVTDEWVKKHLWSDLSGAGLLAAFAIFLFLLVFLPISPRQLIIEVQAGVTEIFIRHPRQFGIIVFLAVWITGWSIGSCVWMSEALSRRPSQPPGTFLNILFPCLISIVPILGAFYLLLKECGIVDTITIREGRLIHRRFRFIYRRERKFLLSNISDLSPEESFIGRSWHLVFRYDGRTRKILGAQDLRSFEAGRILDAIQNPDQIELKDRELAEKQAEENIEAFPPLKKLFRMATRNATPDERKPLLRSLNEAEQKAKPARKPQTQMVWGRSARENWIIIGRNAYAYAMTLVVGAPLAWFVWKKRGIPTYLFMALGPIFALCFILAAVGLGKDIIRLLKHEPLTSKGTWKDDLKATLQLPMAIGISAFITFFVSALLFSHPTRSTGWFEQLRRHLYTPFPVIQTGFDKDGNRFELTEVTMTRLHKYNPQGRLLWAVTTYGIKGQDPEFFIDDNGNTYVLASSVEKFSPDGIFLQEYEGIRGVDQKWRISHKGVDRNLAGE